MLNIGVLGVWHVHTDDYVRQIRTDGRAVIKTVWDEDALAGQAWAEKNSVAFIPDLADFLMDPGINAVICNAPTMSHKQVMVAAAKAGKHIFTEKLLAPAAADGEAIIEAVHGAGVICAVSMPLLSASWVRYTKQIIDSGLLGRITGARMRRSHSGVSDSWLPERWYDVSKSGGGALMDLGAHPVYVLAHLLGKPVRVTGLMTNIFKTTSDENAVALVEFACGVIGMCETAFVTFGVPDILEVYGTDGSVFIHDGHIKIITRSMQKAGLSAAEPVSLPPALPEPVIRFITACVAGGPTPEYLTAEEALVMTRIIEAAYTAERTGKTVRL